MSVVLNTAIVSGVRKATPADLQQMVELGYRLCDKTPYAHIERDRPSIVKTFCVSMSSQFGCAFVAERAGKLTGILVGVAQQLWWSRTRYATDLCFYSEHAGDGYQLLKRFVAWAWKTPGVIEITMGQSSGIDTKRSAALYRRAGLTLVGGIYTAVREERRAA